MIPEKTNIYEAFKTAFKETSKESDYKYEAEAYGEKASRIEKLLSLPENEGGLKNDPNSVIIAHETSYGEIAYVNGSGGLVWGLNDIEFSEEDELDKMTRDEAIAYRAERMKSVPEPALNITIMSERQLAVEVLKATRNRRDFAKDVLSELKNAIPVVTEHLDKRYESMTEEEKEFAREIVGIIVDGGLGHAKGMIVERGITGADIEAVISREYDFPYSLDSTDMKYTIRYAKQEMYENAIEDGDIEKAYELIKEPSFPTVDDEKAFCISQMIKAGMIKESAELAVDAEVPTSWIKQELNGEAEKEFSEFKKEADAITAVKEAKIKNAILRMESKGAKRSGAPAMK